MTIGEKITALRNAAGMSQDALDDRLSVSRQSVSKWETGGATPDLDKLLALCDLFGVTLDELVRGEIAEAEAPAAQPDATAPVLPTQHAVQAEPAQEPAGEHASSTFRIVLICILVFLGFSMFAALLTPLLVGGLPFILIGVGCILFALRK